MNIKEGINNSLNQITQYLQELSEQTEIIELISRTIINSLENENKIIFCGNGGSAAISQHLSAELMGKYKLDRAPLSAISLTTDTSAITAIANDYGFEYIFSRHLQGIGKKGDVLIAISGSGNSKNLIEVLKTANSMGIKTISLTGETGGEMKNFSDITLNVPSKITNYIQEQHLIVGHIICGIVENHFFKK